MIIAGWGKQAKVIGMAGLIFCENCKNVSVWHVYRVNKKVSLYFVPVAKWGTKFYVVCGVCEGGVELTSDQKDEVLRQSTVLPSEQVTTEIWNRLDTHFAEGWSESLAAGGERFAFMGPEVARLKSEYPDAHVDYVLGHFLKYLVHCAGEAAE